MAWLPAADTQPVALFQRHHTAVTALPSFSDPQLRAPCFLSLIVVLALDILLIVALVLHFVVAAAVVVLLLLLLRVLLLLNESSATVPFGMLRRGVECKVL